MKPSQNTLLKSSHPFLILNINTNVGQVGNILRLMPTYPRLLKPHNKKKSSHFDSFEDFFHGFNLNSYR